MKALRMFKEAGAVLSLIVLVLVLALAEAKAADYKGMVDEIGVIFNEALALYKKGDAEQAKLKAQSAYLEVFENLEGPIRINVSAKKNYELEQEFIAIRKMIVDKEPAAAVEQRIGAFMADLRSTTAKLEGGYELVAEASDDSKQPQGATPGSAPAAPRGGAKNVEQVWQQCFEQIRAGLTKAGETYKAGNAKGGAELVVQTQYDQYKNSLFETAVRRHLSLKKDYQNNAAFTALARMMQEGAAPAKVEAQVALLLKGLEQDLPGLPLVDGAESSGQAPAVAQESGPDKDWNQVNAQLFAQMEKAIELYQGGERKEASILVQECYFDIFEASGMEGKIGARDAAFKGQLEGHFSRIAGQMKNGAPVAEIEAAFAALRVDFQKGAEMLGGGKDSPTALFFYSLMIMLREGLEAILVVTAIIAYLVKTGHKDKIRVIYNACFAAIALSVVTALLVKWVFKVSAASQEALEGWTMLLASGVLFSVSYWLISKAEAQKWMAYIKEKVGDSLSSRSLKALWFAAFLAIYREGAETVLFYQALAADASTQGMTAVAGGFVLGCVILVAVFFAMRFGALKLPLRPFFLCTGALLYYMAFVFAGKGMMELIAGKLFEPSLISWMPTLDFIGLYPYVQTLVPQLFIVLAALAGLGLLLRRRTARQA